jgi:hypothetical protein
MQQQSEKSESAFCRKEKHRSHPPSAGAASSFDKSTATAGARANPSFAFFPPNIFLYVKLQRFDFLLARFGFVFARSIFRVAEKTILYGQPIEKSKNCRRV